MKPDIEDSERTAAAAPPYAVVAVPTPLDRLFHYRIPPPLRGRLAEGARVRVPFGRREVVGYCVGFDESAPVEEARLREIARVVDRAPILDRRMLRLARWLADYYCCSWGEALDAMVPGAVRRRATPRMVLLVRAERSAEELRARAEALGRRAVRQARTLRALAATEGEISARDLASLAQSDYAVIRALERTGDLRLRRVPASDDPSLEFGVERTPPPTPTPDQAAALARLERAIDDGAFRVVLLHGVTGSGKTELYIRALERVVARGRQGIVLVPEIALTPQTVARFRARFDRVCVLHSELTDRRRRAQWRMIREGRADIVIGARSAVFAPVPRLGLLVVDEEHETSFKQQSVPRYHARDVGIWRARQEGALVILGSATPSLESYHNARSGKYDLITLPRRVGGLPLPRVEVIDMAAEAGRGAAPLLSRRLALAVESALAGDEQVILFLNRRGFHTRVTCPRCGFALKCAECDVSLTYHRGGHRAICHYCGHQEPAPEACPVCGLPKLRYRGTGTQRVEEEIAQRFGREAVARMDSDSMRGWGRYEETLGHFRDGQTRILLGTQMVAKGHDFPNVTLVGVVNADVILNMPDFRASERTFQLLAQVAGRAGRSERGGRVLIQTFSPRHPCVRFAREHDYARFVEHEMRARRSFGYPPFSRLARILVEGKSAEAVRSRIAAIASAIRPIAAERQVRLLGPAEAPIGRLKGLYRWHAILKAESVAALRDVLKAVDRRRVKGTHVVVDVDPVGML